MGSGQDQESGKSMASTWIVQVLRVCMYNESIAADESTIAFISSSSSSSSSPSCFCYGCLGRTILGMTEG